MQSFTLGVDLGTGSCKSLALSPSGTVLSIGTAAYPAADLHTRFQEQHPETLLQAVFQSIRAVFSLSDLNPAGCLGISIAGALHSLLVLDSQDHPLTGVITWADERAAIQADYLKQNSDVRQLYLDTGCPNHALYPRTKILWLRQEHPDLFFRAAWFISAKEYILLRLTGQRMVDYSIAGASGLLNTRNLVWDDEILALLEIKKEQLFALGAPDGKVGSLLPEAAAEAGLPPETPVFLGSSDAVNSSLGAGSVRSNQITCMVGTSGALRFVSPHPILDPNARLWCYSMDPSHWLIGGAINNGGIVLQWFQNALSTGANPLDFDQILSWAAEIKPGAEGVLCLPFFTGERSPNWNSQVRGVFYGLALDHDRRHMARALLEGVGFRLRSVLDALDEIAGPFKEVRASGGFAASPIWLQISAEILDRPLTLVNSKESSALAAAFWPFLGLGLANQVEDIASFVTIARQIEPNPNHRDTYQRQYARYKELYQAILPFFLE